MNGKWAYVQSGPNTGKTYNATKIKGHLIFDFESGAEALPNTCVAPVDNFQSFESYVCQLICNSEVKESYSTIIIDPLYKMLQLYYKEENINNYAYIRNIFNLLCKRGYNILFTCTLSEEDMKEYLPGPIYHFITNLFSEVPRIEVNEIQDYFNNKEKNE